MAHQAESVLPQPLQGWARISNEFHKHEEYSAIEVPYKWGASLTSLDAAKMKITLDKNADTHFWKPSDTSTRCALEDALEEHSQEIEILLIRADMSKKELTECRCPTIQDASGASIECIRLLRNSADRVLLMGMFDSDGDNLFQDLDIRPWHSDGIEMEFRLIFESPGYPHVTILSIQPQRASSNEELLCTEVWSLFIYASTLARRALRTTTHVLPIRLISICGYEARVISSAFSLGYLQEFGEGMGRKTQSAKCQIHIAEYRDLSDRRHFQDLMRELVAIPCGNVNKQSKMRSSSFRRQSVSQGPLSPSMNGGKSPDLPTLTPDGDSVNSIYRKQAARLDELEKENRRLAKEAQENEKRWRKAEEELEEIREVRAETADAQVEEFNKLTAEVAGIERRTKDILLVSG